MKLGIEDLRLFDINSYRALSEAGVNNLGKLLSMSTDTLFKVPELGTRRIQKIHSYVAYKNEEARVLGRHRNSSDVSLNHIINAINKLEGNKDLVYNRDGERIKQIISNLSAFEKQLIYLRYSKYMSVIEIAASLKIEKKKVECGLSKALHKVYLEFNGKSEVLVDSTIYINDIGNFVSGVYSSLSLRGVTRFDQLQALSDEDLLSLPGVGVKKLAKIKDYMNCKARCISIKE